MTICYFDQKVKFKRITWFNFDKNGPLYTEYRCIILVYVYIFAIIHQYNVSFICPLYVYI